MSPEEEKEGFGGKDLQIRKVLSLGRKSEGVMDTMLANVQLQTPLSLCCKLIAEQSVTVQYVLPSCAGR